MVHYTFEHDGNHGMLRLITHNGQEKTIKCDKESHQTFRVGGTATNGLMKHVVTVKSINRLENTATAEINKLPSVFLVGSIYELPNSRVSLNETAIAIEYYPLDMEGKAPQWVIASKNIDQPEILFINIDCLDGGFNIIKRYRISPYNGEYKLMGMNHGP